MALREHRPGVTSESSYSWVPPQLVGYRRVPAVPCIIPMINRSWITLLWQSFCNQAFSLFDFPVTFICWALSATRLEYKQGAGRQLCHAARPPCFKCLIVSLPYFACMIASIALMAALRRPFSSREATPLMVVPPGEHTASLSTAGCLPVSTAILPVPAIICPASW